jgi:hypothetical protein
MKKFSIQIREEEKSFSKAQLAEVLNISRSTLNRWILLGKILSPTVNNKRYSKENLKLIFKKMNFEPTVDLNENNRTIWQDIENSYLILKSGGIFASYRLANQENQLIIDKLIKDYGLWDAQGLNNHEHIKDYIKNPILQLFLSEKLIGLWINQVKKLKPKGKIVIYWNGHMDSTVCIYSMRELDNEFLQNFDRYLKIKNIVISEMT